MAYDLTRLGSTRFEHLVQALAIGRLGHGIQIFGAGPDGGREATFHGEVDMEGKGTWDGYGVIQAKYKDKLSTTAADQAWFFQEVTAELDAWIDPKKKRHRHKPDYLLVVTNVPLTSVTETGGLDRLDRLFDHYRNLTVELHDGTVRRIGMPDFKDYHVWHAEYLDRLLDNNGDVCRRYADLVLPGDVIARLYDQVSATDERLAHAWIGHIARSLNNDTVVELGESGDDTNSPLSLAEVAVDLPASFTRRDEPRSAALRSLVARGDQVLSPDLTPAARDRVVVLGGPGSGKSTVSRLLCQLYRVALVQDPANGRVTPQVAAQANEIRAALDVAGLPRPTLHRLPVRVVLSDFADAVTRKSSELITKTSPSAETGVAESRHLTLLQHIVTLINRRGSDPINVAEAKRLLTAWPLLVVLDGMDEVASADNRVEVTERIADFLTEMAALGADVFTVCTSRPMGFEHDRNIAYEELHLTELTPNDAKHYARRLLASRFAGNPDRQEQTLERLDKASRNADTARLMTSPLQVTIMSLLLEQRYRPPTSRYALFKNYYDTIYARECNKPRGIGDVLEAHRPLFDQLHERCGLAIHTRAERAGAADSILPIDDLEAIARDIIESEGHRKSETNTLIGQTLRLAQERLVLLVPRGEGLAFEVRTLTEFFAARCLMAGEDAADKLELLVPSAHWNHTWLLAAGYIFAERLQQRDAVAMRLSAADHSNAVNRLVMPGAVLAVKALEDGFAINAPRFERDLLVAALRLLRGPTGSHITSLAHALVPFMERSKDLADTAWREIEALLADHSPGATRAFLAGLTESQSDAIAVRATNRLAAYVEQRGGTPTPNNKDDDDSTTAAIRTDLAAQLLIVDIADPESLQSAARLVMNNGANDELIKRERDLLVEACGNDYSLRSRIRAPLAIAIAHDVVGHLLSPPAPTQ